MFLLSSCPVTYNSFAKTSKLITDFERLEPNEVTSLLNETIDIGDLWMKPGFLIAKYGSKALFERTASIIKDSPVHSEGFTLLHTVVAEKEEKVDISRVLYLLNLIDINVLDHRGRTCLFYVQSSNLFDILIQRGIDYNHVDKRGMVAGEYRHDLVYPPPCVQFYQYNALPLLKLALKYNKANLAHSTHEYVDTSQWSYDLRLKLFMLLAFNHIYSHTSEYYLSKVLPPEILHNPQKLHNVIDEYCIKTYGGYNNSRRINFVVEGMKNLLMDRYDTRLVCFLKFHNEMLREPDAYCRYWYFREVNLKELLDQTPNPIDYAQKFVDCTRVHSQSHWCLIINWLYTARKTSPTESYEHLMRKAVQLRDAWDNTLLHILAWKGMLQCVRPDIEWIEWCIKLGAHVDALNENNETPLFIALRVALYEENEPFCRLMIKWNAHLDAITYCKDIPSWLKQVFGSEYSIPFPSLQCLAAKKCNWMKDKLKTDYLPQKMKHFIKLHG